MLALDLETAPTDGHPSEYALQPWRVREGKARITSIGIGSRIGCQFYDVDETRDFCDNNPCREPVALWNGVFDLAWLLAAGVPYESLARVKWIDGMLLWKWLEPNRQTFKLVQAATRWLPDDRFKGEFEGLKALEVTAGDNPVYWKRRNEYDVRVTALVVRLLLDMLTCKMPRALTQIKIEAACLLPTARSWLEGIPVDPEHAKSLQRPLEVTRDRILGELGVDAKVLASPKQLSNLLYNEWGWPEQFRTPTGAPSTDKSALTYAVDHDMRAALILDYREAQTRLTKFVEGTLRAVAYLGKDVVHPSPFLYSTYTGRMTYSSKTLKKFQTGVALHQWPRPKELRQIIVAPEGHALVEFDFSGQENRWMAIYSGDPAMTAIFENNGDIHSYTGAGIGHLRYEEFMRRKAAGDVAIVSPKGLRYLGKFTNLSLQYRTSRKTLRRKARVDYGVVADMPQASHWYNTYHGLYPCVRKYWNRAIEKGRERGYAETIGGRRYYLTDWSEDGKWGSESTAINHPIQGTGADQKELALSLAAAKFPEMRFAFDLHDGLYFWVPLELVRTPEFLLGVKHALSNLPYLAAWGRPLPFGFPVDGQHGARWGAMEDV